jgi:hypothetical protein
MVKVFPTKKKHNYSLGAKGGGGILGHLTEVYRYSTKNITPSSDPERTLLKNKQDQIIPIKSTIIYKAYLHM